MSRRFKRVMAYVYMPLLLSLVSFLIVYICLLPYIGMVSSAFSLLSGNNSDTALSTSIEEQTFFEWKNEDEGRQPESIPYSPSMYPKVGELYAQISCDRLGIHENVYFGDSNEILDLGVGQYAGSSIFGYGKQALLGGHHGSKFKPLEHVENGDVFVVKTSYGEYEYEVYDSRVANEKDKSAYSPAAEGEIIVMYTCYPFTPLASYTQRLYVYAKKISGPDLIH